MDTAGKTNESGRRATHRAAVGRALAAFSARDLQGFLDCLHEEVTFELPFDPDVPALNKDGVARLVAGEMELYGKQLDFQILQVYDLVDADGLIVDYASDFRSSIGDVTYANHYIAIFEFADDLIRGWREFTSPVVYQRALAELDAAGARQSGAKSR